MIRLERLQAEICKNYCKYYAEASDYVVMDIRHCAGCPLEHEVKEQVKALNDVKDYSLQFL